MQALLDTPLEMGIAGLFALALLLMLVALQQLRRGRKGEYWRLRRDSGQRGGQLFLIAATLFGIAVVLAVFAGWGSLLVDDTDDEPATTPAPVAESTQAGVTPVPTRDLDATAAVMVAGTLTAVYTPPSTPGPTATATPTPVTAFDGLLRGATPLPVEALPLPDSVLAITALAPGITAQGEPEGAGTVFAAGITQVYVFFRFANMADDVSWRWLLSREGVPVAGQADHWRRGETGSGYVFTGTDAGFPPGDYAITLYINGESVAQQTFRVE